MILPTKHVNFAESLLGLAGFLLRELDSPKTVESLWDRFQQFNDSAVLPAYHTFEDFVLAVDFLYLSGKLNLDKNGRLSLEAD